MKMLPMLAEMAILSQAVATGPAKSDQARQLLAARFPHPAMLAKDATLHHAPCVITRDPKTGKRNVGMYRMQIYDERTTGMHWHGRKLRPNTTAPYESSGNEPGCPPSVFAKGGNTAA